MLLEGYQHVLVWMIHPLRFTLDSNVCAKISEIFTRMNYISPRRIVCNISIAGISLYPLVTLPHVHPSPRHLLLGVQGWPATEFSAAIAVVAAYLLLALLGPVIMSNFSPVESYPVRFVYNMVQVSSLPSQHLAKNTNLLYSLVTASYGERR